MTDRETNLKTEGPIKVGIIYGSLFNGNLGVQALTYSLISLLEEVGDKLGHSLEYFLFETESTAVSGDLSLPKKSVSFTTVPFSGFGKKLWFTESGRRFLKVGGDCDIVFDIGGGDSFSDIYGKKRFFSLWMAKQKLKSVGTPVVMTPQTIGPFKNWLVRQAANRALNQVTAVYPRDQLSTNYLKSCLANDATIREFVDMAFFLPFEKEPHELGNTKVGLNISGLLFNGGYSKNNQFGLATDYPEMIRKLVQKLSSDSSVDLRLVPHVISEKVVVEDDLAVCRKLADEFGLTPPPNFKTPIEAKTYISGMSFFMGARMHSTIAAYSSGTPVLPMAYSRKFNGLFIESLGLKSMIDLKVDSVETVMHKVDEGLANRETMRDELAVSLKRIKAQRQLLMDCFAENLKSALATAN